LGSAKNASDTLMMRSIGAVCSAASGMNSSQQFSAQTKINRRGPTGAVSYPLIAVGEYRALTANTLVYKVWQPPRAIKDQAPASTSGAFILKAVLSRNCHSCRHGKIQHWSA
jgi:hypothetical protein